MLSLEETLKTFKIQLAALEYPLLFSQSVIREFGVLPFPTLELRTKGCLKTCQDLFLYARSCSLEEVLDAFGEELTDALHHYKIFILTSASKSKVKSRFRILWFLQQALLIPYRKYLSGDPVYIGADSFTLFRNVQLPSSCSSVLDLFTGSGIQLLLQSCHVFKGLGIDSNPTAIETARLNAVMNDLDRKFTFYQADISQLLHINSLLEFLPVNVILANPPILPVPPNSRYADQKHSYGGSDGLKYIRQTCLILPDLLHPQGLANILLCSLGKEKPFFLSEINSLLPSSFHYTLICLKKIPIELDVIYRPKKEQKTWLEHFTQLEAKYWFRLLLRIDGTLNKSKYVELNRTHFDVVPSSSFVVPSALETKFLSALESKGLSIALLQEKSLYDAGIDISKLFPELFPSIGDSIKFWAKFYEKRLSLAYERVLW
ncbi:MAG: hypothetical protein ACFFCZ_11725 [Promethearchaeota archaeon]